MIDPRVYSRNIKKGATFFSLVLSNLGSSIKKLAAICLILLVVIFWPEKSVETNDYFSQVTFKKYSFSYKRYYNKQGDYLFSSSDFLNVKSGKDLQFSPFYDKLGGLGRPFDLIDYSGPKVKTYLFYVYSPEYYEIFNLSKN